MPICVVLTGYSVNSVARDILTSAKCGEQMGKVKANTLLGLQCFANVEVLEKRITVVVVLQVGYDPIIKRSHLFLVGFTTGTNFVSSLSLPELLSTIPKYIISIAVATNVNIGRTLRQERALTILITMTRNRIVKAQESLSGTS